MNSQPRSERTGKAAVPLLVILVVLLLGVSGAVSFLFIQEREQLQAKERELVLIQADRDDLRIQLEDTRDRAERVEVERDQIRKELLVAEEDLEEALTAQQTLAEAVEAREREIARLNNDLQQALEAQNGFTERVAQLTSEVDALQAQVAQLNAGEEGAAGPTQVADARSVELDRVVVTGEGTGGSGAVGPASAGPLSGEVVVINREYDFVVMNLGKNHGLAIGQEFQIVRDEAVLGTVKVEKVYDELSAAAIQPDSDEEGIREGDEVRAL